jgi:hypothetical protein
MFRYSCLQTTKPPTAARNLNPGFFCEVSQISRIFQPVQVIFNHFPEIVYYFNMDAVAFSTAQKILPRAFYTRAYLQSGFSF